MSFSDIYAEAIEAGIFDNIYGEQSLDNTVIENPDALEYEEPSFYSSQSSTSPYFLKAPICSDLAKGEDFSFGDLQPTPVDRLRNTLCDRSITFESPVTLSRSTSTSSATRRLKSLAKNSRRSLLSPPQRNFITKQDDIQRKKPKKETFYRSYGYQPLYIALSSWDIFEYNSFGELNPGRTYSALELVRYLYSNPQNQVGETYNPKLGGLTLWIQKTPQDFATDYGHPEAALCRFQDCEHNKNAIKAGEVRVAFDELTKRISNLNPQRNAGYVHLSCLEKKTNFPKLCNDFDVQPETRIFPLEVTHRNPMILQGGSMLEHVQRFLDFCNQMGRPPKSHSAQGRLIDEILQLEPRKLKKGLVEWGDVEDDKAGENQSPHRKRNMYNVLAPTRLKKDDDTIRPKKEKEIVLKKKRARRAENERNIKSESKEEHEREHAQGARGGGFKARAIIRRRGRRTRRAHSTPPPSESDSDSSSSALTELDTESEDFP